MKTIVWIFLGSTVIWGAWYLFRGLQTPPPDNSQNQNISGSIKIGAILPLTGSDAARGLAIQKAGKLALEEINAAGGIDKRTVEVIWEDGKCDTEAALAATQKLILTDAVGYILGGICSSEVISGAEFAQISGVVWISPSATSSAITDIGDYIFRTAPSEALEGAVAAQFAFTVMGAKSAAIFSENKEYAQVLRGAFKESFEKLGGSILADEMYASEDSSFRSQVMKIKSAKADVLYFVPQNPASGIAIMKQLKDQKIASKIITGEVLLGKDVAEQNAKTLEGLIGIGSHSDSESPETVKFTENFKQRYNESPTFLWDMANYYSSFYLLKTAIQNAGDNARMIKDWLSALKDWEHALGKLSFDSNGDRVGAYRVLEVRSGAVEEKEVIFSTAE